ncbi:LOW QUALITY PROTEIN: lethal(3)malignant brain tumor-like protein 4 [Dama dama]
MGAAEMGSPHRRSGRTGRTPEAASEPGEPAETGCARRPDAGAHAEEAEPTLPARESRPHARRAPLGEPAAAALMPQRCCPAARAPRCRSAQVCRRVRPAGGEALLRDQPFPEQENGFQAGIKLEGINHQHPSLFCVLSIAEVCCYHLWLHFNGYLSCYDFTNVGFPDICPVGWCEKTKRDLYIPQGYGKDKFIWMDCLKAKLQNAPKKFEFQISVKLEDIDRKNPALICVATIADIVGSCLQVHFDNWDDSYDFCDVSSPLVQPVGWCREHGRTLIEPQGLYKRLYHGFLLNVLEVVDKRNPRICLATIVDVDDQRIKVHFGGWDHKYYCWVDADSPDLHPIAWCDITGHPLECSPDASPQTDACALIFIQTSVFGCPCLDRNLKKEATLQGRLRELTQANVESGSDIQYQKNLCSLNFSGRLQKVSSQSRLVRQTKCLKIKGEEDIDLDTLPRGHSATQMPQALLQPVSTSSLSAQPFRDPPLGQLG